jgi:hypothetical protein
MNDAETISRERSLSIRRTNAIMWQNIGNFRYARARISYIYKNYAHAAKMQREAAEAFTRMQFYRDRYQFRLSSEK